MIKDLVTVIIPVYNKVEYLRDSLNSVINQTYSNIEIIVVDDGSNNSGKILNICNSFNKKIRIIKLNKNSGVSVALNRGILTSNGKYINWLSHDDLFLPTKIEEQIKFALLTLFPDIIDCLTMPVINKIKLLISTQMETFDGIKDIIKNITATVQASGKIEIGEIMNVFTTLKANPVEAVQVFTHIIQNSDNIKETMRHIVKKTFASTSAFSDFVFRFIIFVFRVIFYFQKNFINLDFCKSSV
jgi:glycosyltransferase involved in cell wall biosynthesis